MSKEDGGPAFPSTLHDATDIHERGMSLRDAFAIAVLQGMSAIPDGRTASESTVEQGAIAVENWRTSLQLSDARYCWTMADAMLAERNK